MVALWNRLPRGCLVVTMGLITMGRRSCQAGRDCISTALSLHPSTYLIVIYQIGSLKFG
jgi:hypothetical protein